MFRIGRKRGKIGRGGGGTRRKKEEDEAVEEEEEVVEEEEEERRGGEVAAAAMATVLNARRGLAFASPNFYLRIFLMPSWVGPLLFLIFFIFY